MSLYTLHLCIYRSKQQLQLSTDEFALSPFQFTTAELDQDMNLRIRQNTIAVPHQLQPEIQKSTTVDLQHQFDILLFRRIVRGKELFTSFEYEATFKRNNYTVKLSAEGSAYNFGEIQYFVSFGAWNNDHFNRFFTGAVIQPLQTVGPCLVSEVPLPEVCVTHWPSSTIEVCRTGQLQLYSINSLISKCAPVEVRRIPDQLYVTEPPNSIEIDL